MGVVTKVKGERTYRYLREGVWVWLQRSKVGHTQRTYRYLREGVKVKTSSGKYDSLFWPSCLHTKNKSIIIIWTLQMIY